MYMYMNLRMNNKLFHIQHKPVTYIVGNLIVHFKVKVKFSV